uniref:AlNc14C252G9672 protein n=1 Tax=Albugo laibachii Nc14 TaxID=890382 RepID=F0WTJ3_9STRA|nr:AlNc14C252G9672 [Albugo laibachii Nc14]|eukprot:CCA24684.1 AlNc14C252G9672 [Albugo laibachii Nc14]
MFSERDAESIVRSCSDHCTGHAHSLNSQYCRYLLGKVMQNDDPKLSKSAEANVGVTQTKSSKLEISLSPLSTTLLTNHYCLATSNRKYSSHRCQGCLSYRFPGLITAFILVPPRLRKSNVHLVMHDFSEFKDNANTYESCR